jgi:mono/diheme cytochrome c family protein
MAASQGSRPLARRTAAWAFALAAALVVGGAWGQGKAANPERGQALYENRCGGCHAESVHGRRNRVAADFAQVRDQVRRWDRNLGGGWSNDELDDVTVFLNKRYYGYPCPSPLCSAAVSLLRPEDGRAR